MNIQNIILSIEISSKQKYLIRNKDFSGALFFIRNKFNIETSLGKTVPKLTFISNISSHQNTFKRNLFHILRNRKGQVYKKREHIGIFKNNISSKG